MVKQITSNNVIYVIIFFINCGLKVHGTNKIDCNFEDGWCNWKQADNDDFNWKRISGNTPTSNTGPNADHTTGDGFYAYIDTRNSKVNPGYKARLKSPRLNPGTYCFSIWYYMYGWNVDRLKVSKIGNETATLFEVSENQGEKWILAQQNFTASVHFRIVMEGRVKNTRWHAGGDIAIDDTLMFPGECPKGCSTPVPAFGISDSTDFTVGAVVKIRCMPGYEITVNSSIHCQINGSWSDKPECQPIDCGERKIENGKFTTTSGTVFEQIAEQSCNTGYIFAGDKKIICTESGWNGTEATCTIVDCSTPSMTHSLTSETLRDTTYNQTVRLSCADDYTLTGNSIITCQADGNWTILPTCLLLESDNKALIAVYVSVPIIIVALDIGLTVIMMRKGLIKCMSKHYHNKKNATTSQTKPGSSFSNRAYIGHNIESQTDKENRLPEDTDYAVITEEQDRKRQSESYVYYNTVDVTITQRENDDHAYNHTDNVTAPFFDMSYSHVSKNNDENNVKSNYNTAILPCRTNEGFQSDVQDENNKYDILDSNVAVQRSGTELEEDLDPEYDHAKAGGTDPEDLDDYSHLNGAVTVMKPIKNDLKEVSGTEYEYANEISEAEPNGTYPAQVGKVVNKPHYYDLEVDNRDDRHYFVLEKEDNENAEQSGSFESNVHDYFVLEKMET